MGYIPPSSSYTPLMLSHQTGLSITASTANTFYAIGSSISIPRNGIAIISMSGHINAGEGYIQLKLTRGSTSYLFGSSEQSLFANNVTYSSYSLISNTSSLPLSCVGSFDTNLTSVGANPSFILPVYSGDSLQFYATNSTANDVTYIDDVLVMLI